MGFRVTAVDKVDDWLKLATELGADRVVNAATQNPVAEVQKHVRGSIVGTRAHLIESLAFAGEGRVKPHASTDRLDHINAIFERTKAGAIDGRAVKTL